jgi:membrane protease YdiL (CAAX protease family)
MPGPLDLAVVALFAAAWPLWEYFVTWPRHVRAVDAGDPTARTRTYQRTILEQWVLTALVVAVMLRAGREFSLVWLVVPTGWRLWLGVALPVIYVALVAVQSKALFAKPASMAKLRASLHPLRALIPYTATEYAWFRPLAVTAGICEEFLFRGYLVWVLSAWIGLYPAAAVSMVVFGLGHAYQGPAFATRAFAAGVAMGLLALATRSVLPGMVLHAAIDLVGGWITNRVIRETAA